MNPTPPPTPPPPPPVDRDGYPKLCCVCGKPVLLKHAAIFLTVLDRDGRRVVSRTSQHVHCKEG